MFKILFTILPMLFFGAIGFHVLYAQWAKEYAAPVLPNDLTRGDWLVVGLFSLVLVMIGLIFNLIAVALGGI
ncbi:MAG TPA: hypothetical protein ENI23_07550 [bacterium]|nr:hypothetical protein [bacterium]